MLINNIIELGVLSIEYFFFVVILFIVFILIVDVVIIFVGVDALILLTIWLIVIVQLL